MLHNSLINTKLLKEFSVIPLNFDTKEVENFINIAQTIWIKPVIGQDFFDELLEQVQNNEVTEENGTALVEAIYPYLGLAVCYEALPTMAYHVSEVSITKGHSDNSDAIDLKELAYYEQFIRRQLEAAKDYCIKWLCERSETFPLITTCECDCCSCCHKAKLNKPNPRQLLHTTCRKRTDIN